MACSPDGPVVIYKSMLIVVDFTLGNMYTDVTINKDINYLITVHLRSYLHEHETPKQEDCLGSRGHFIFKRTCIY